MLNRRCRGRRSRASRVRPLLFFSFVALANTLGAACAACAGGQEASDSSAIALPARTPSEAGAAPSEAAAPAIDVGGLVVDDDDEPVIGRPITVVDSLGQRSSLLTDEGGGFWALSVVPPYDVLVAPAPSGAVITPLVYMGLRRKDPRVEVFEHDGPAPHPASETLRVTVALPPCRGTSGSCFVSVVSASATGQGATAASYFDDGQAAPTTVFEVEHAFTAAALVPAETIEVHVLTGDAEYTQYQYAAMGDLVAAPGETNDVAMLTPAPVDSSEPVSIAARSAGVPLGWEWTISSELDLLGGASIALRYDWSSSSALRLPLLPGATWSVNAWAEEPASDDETAPRRTSQARSGALPVGSADVALDLPTPPLGIAPAREGTISRALAALTWRGDPALASVIVIDDATGQQLFRAYTSERSIALARLAALGLPPLEAGSHTFDLQTTAGADVDSLAEPDAEAREQRFGIDHPGGSTYQRYRFTVTR